jgi:hypothetical protein
MAARQAGRRTGSRLVCRRAEGGHAGLRQASDRWQAVKKTNFVLGICGKDPCKHDHLISLWHCDDLSKNEVLNLGRSVQGRIVKNDISHATQGS